MQKGFTLIECLISILLLAIIMAGGMSFYFNSTGLSIASEHKNLAVDIANKELESIRDQAARSGYGSLSCGPCVSRAVQVGALANTGNVETCISCVPGFDYKKIDVKVYWDEPGKGERDLTFATYISK